MVSTENLRTLLRTYFSINRHRITTPKYTNMLCQTWKNVGSYMRIFTVIINHKQTRMVKNGQDITPRIINDELEHYLR